VNVIAARDGWEQIVRKNAINGGSVRIAHSNVFVRSQIPTRVIQLMVGAFVKPNIKVVKRLNMLASDVRARVRWATMAKIVIISVTAKTIHHVIRQPVNASANAVGWEDRANKNVRRDILVRIVKRGVPTICHQRRHAIT
jgi:hypothetical protein